MESNNPINILTVLAHLFATLGDDKHFTGTIKWFS